MPTKKMMMFYNDYHLDPSYEDKVRKKKIEVDLSNRRQLFNIIKKRLDYKVWQPERKERQKLLRALEDIDIKEEKIRKQRMQHA